MCKTNRREVALLQVTLWCVSWEVLPWGPGSFMKTNDMPDLIWPPYQRWWCLVVKLCLTLL